MRNLWEITKQLKCIVLQSSIQSESYGQNKLDMMMKGHVNDYGSKAGSHCTFTMQCVMYHMCLTCCNLHPRYLVSDDRVLFMLKDGSLAWDVKNFLITQPDCKLVEFDNQQFPGAGEKAESAKTEL